ncbi:unnamed protein product [Caenorhabditis nigoni]
MAADSSVPVTEFSHFEIKSLKDTKNEFDKMRSLAMKVIRKENKDKYKNGYLEALNPYQNEIGCSKRNGWSGYLCFLAPLSYLRFWGYDSDAIPGSDCPSDYYGTNSLCVFLGDPGFLLDRINNVRRKLARQYSISDMHQVRPRKELIPVITDDFKRNKRLDISPYHIFSLKHFNYTEKEIEKEIYGFLRMSETKKAEYWKKPGLKFAEFITPSLTTFSCEWILDVEKFLCIFGPRFSEYLWNMNLNPLEVPETRCPDGNLKDNGLCYAYFGNQNGVLGNINSARNAAARVLKIGNMLKLTWDDKLAEIAKSDKWKSGEPIPGFRVNWRHVLFSRPDYEFQNIWSFHIGWMNKTSREQDQFITKNSLEMLELLDPYQSKIGCDLTIPRGARCVIGPHGDLKRYDKEPKINPLSKCPDGYHIKDGLCIQLGDSNEFLDHLNEFRRKYSVEHNITNMHQMIWEKDLVRVGERIDWSESKKPNVKDYRYVLLNDFRDIENRLKEQVAKLKTFTSSDLDNALQKWSKTSLGLSELLDPLQKFIGCAHKNQPIAPGILCILGPRHYPTPLKLENPPQRILGTASKFRIYTAGTNCSSGYENDRGLCTVKDIKNISLVGSLDHFLKDLNEFRRDVAKEFNIQSMHQLEWNSDLESMIESLDIDETWQEARKSFRFVLFDEYNRVLDRIHHNISWIRYLDSKLKWKILDSKTECAGFLELVEPHQTMIACGRKTSKKSGKSKILCLIGPHPAIQLWLMTPLGPRELGITCVNTPGYENDDGLCVKKSGIDPNFYGDHKNFLDELNKSRKNRAMFFSIPNFYALSWSEELVEKSKTFPYTTDPVPNPEIQGYRYFTMGTYKEFNEGDITSEWITKIRHLKVDEAREKYIKDRLTTTLGILETQHPGQHSIGCSLRNEKSGVFLLCLLAPEISYPLLKFQPLQRVGTKCPDGYKNVNGLCAPGEKPPKRKRKSRTSTQKPSSTTQKAKKSTDHLMRSTWKVLIPLFLFQTFLP